MLALLTCYLLSRKSDFTSQGRSLALQALLPQMYLVVYSCSLFHQSLHSLCGFTWILHIMLNRPETHCITKVPNPILTNPTKHSPQIHVAL